MINLLKKEFSLAMHPTAPMFLALSAMLIIPNYPYYVVFFYTGLAIFFTCLSGRENNDIFYSMLLPVSKRKIVAARFIYAVILEMAQIAIAVPFALIRQSMDIGGNAVGMDAGISLFALSLPMMTLFNAVFFGSYYKDVKKVGASFAKASIAMFLYIAVAETLAHIIPFMRDVLDTPDTEYVPEKLIVLAVCVLIYATGTFFVYRRAVKNFEKQDI